MRYTKKMFGLELRSKLDLGEDFVQISEWAFKRYNDPDLEFDRELSHELLRLALMQEGPEFFLSLEDLSFLSRQLISK